MGLLIVVGGSCDEGGVDTLIGSGGVEGCGEVEAALGEMLLDLGVGNRGNAPVYEVDLLRDDIHEAHLVVARQHDGIGQPHVTGTCHGNLLTHGTSLSSFTDAIIGGGCWEGVWGGCVRQDDTWDCLGQRAVVSDGHSSVRMNCS